MNLRLKFVLYLVAIHVLFAGVAVYLLHRDRIWLLAVEAIFVVSLITGVRLIRNLFGTIEMINTGAQFISDSDFTSRFREVGQPEMDQLINIYNRMVDHLREERTRQQEQHYFLDKILKASPSGILTLDLDGRIAMANPAAGRILQSSSGDIFGKKLSEIDAPFFVELSRLGTGESRVIALQGRRRIKCQKSQFLDRGFARQFILMEELTEELRQTEKAAYEKLIRMMSHEVNNSVGSANSLLHSCLNYKDQLSEEDRRDFEMALSVVISRTDHLNAFMRSFADVVRLPPPKLLPCNVEQLLEDIAVLMKAEAARRQIDWVWDFQSPGVYVPMDRSQMEQVFVNIFKNAIEAIGTEGTITVRTGEKNGRRFVVIEDTGSGILPEARPRLFSPFFSTKENGQGIGLTMVQEILDQHHFEFSLESEPGQPTQFRIYF
ncbi:MAG TPA: ATP-binding protein [Blastocatellia bacterium]|nr:ATP-binding protein [Blastocatellia bacterium]